MNLLLTDHRFVSVIDLNTFAMGESVLMYMCSPRPLAQRAESEQTKKDLYYQEKLRVSSFYKPHVSF